MRIKIQDKIPYQQALKWQWHHSYLHNRGTEAWLNNEIPFAITSNYRAAWQNARMIFEVLQSQPQRKGKPEPIYILETGGGLGVFALNFLRAFTALCQEAGTDYFERLHYLLTDYSHKTLEEVALNPYISDWREQGTLELYVMDLTEPDTMTESIK